MRVCFVHVCVCAYVWCVYVCVHVYVSVCVYTCVCHQFHSWQHIQRSPLVYCQPALQFYFTHTLQCVAVCYSALKLFRSVLQRVAVHRHIR